jgi:superfamily II DNA/RNA helicase
LLFCVRNFCRTLIFTESKKTMSFEALGLTRPSFKAVTERRLQKPTPVQSRRSCRIAGRDLLVSSQTGSGKTAAFMLPALHKFASAEPGLPAVPAQEASQARKPVASASVSKPPSRKCWC